MKKGKIKIDEQRCKGCFLCIPVCPKDEIKQSTKINKFGNFLVEFKNEGRCNACTLCAIVCPDAAIEVFELIEEEVNKK